MARLISSVGAPAISQSLQILSRRETRPFTIVPRSLILVPGAMWDHDTVLLAASHHKVEYARGDTLFQEDTFDFLSKTYTPGSKQPVWMSTLVSEQVGFVFKMAHTLSPWWGPRGSVCAWLNSFGTFYCRHRPELEAAGRDVRLLLDGLFGLRPLWTSLFDSLAVSMGEGGRQVFERWVGANDVAPLLGILLGSRGEQEISVDGLVRGFALLRETPTHDFKSCMASPPYPMMVRRAEDAATRLAPVIARLRAEL